MLALIKIKMYMVANFLWPFALLPFFVAAFGCAICRNNSKLLRCIACLMRFKFYTDLLS